MFAKFTMSPSRLWTVGATAANLLGRDGFETVVVEKAAEIYDKPCAIAFNDDSSLFVGGKKKMTESNGVLTTLFKKWDCCSVVVRLDRYICGVARNEQNPNTMLQIIRKRLTS